MKKLTTIFLIALTTIFFSCKSTETTTNPKDLVKLEIKEKYQTEYNEADNVDSPAFWKNGKDAWLISTAKATHRLLINDASNGKLIKYFGKAGKNQKEFSRPNGVTVIDSLLFVVERDNHRVQVLTLPELKFVAFIGEKDLSKPYGIFVHKENGLYKVYVTDSYETITEEVPSNNELDKRVLLYQLDMSRNFPSHKLIKKFGDTEGNGTLKVVESIYGDIENDNLLIAEEYEPETSIKVYDFEGNFKDKVIGKGIFKHQVEGIALYKIGKDKGFWIITDQALNGNTFHVFDRTTFMHLGYFVAPKTTNTDGVCLTQTNFVNFPRGAFFPVHNDQAVSCIDLSEILKAFGK